MGIKARISLVNLEDTHWPGRDHDILVGRDGVYIGFFFEDCITDDGRHISKKIDMLTYNNSNQRRSSQVSMLSNPCLQWFAYFRLPPMILLPSSALDSSRLPKILNIYPYRTSAEGKTLTLLSHLLSPSPGYHDSPSTTHAWYKHRIPSASPHLQPFTSPTPRPLPPNPNHTSNH